MALLPSQRRRFYEQDVAGGVSVSEFLGGEIGSTINFIFDRVVQVLEFGFSGAPFSNFSSYPHTPAASSEVAIENYEILRVTASLQVTGTDSLTTFYLERRPFGSGTWTSIFSTHCTISNVAADNVIFSSDGVAPSGVTLPVLNISSINAGDEIRIVLTGAAAGAKNLKVRLEVGPL